VDAFEAAPLQLDTAAELRPHGKENRFEPLLVQLRDAEINSQLLVGPEFDSRGEQLGDLFLQDILRQPVARNPVAQHAAGFGPGFEHGDGVSHLAQIIGRREPGRTGSDHGRPSSRFRRHRRDPGRKVACMVCGKAFGGADRDGSIDFRPLAGRLAGMRANPSEHAGKGRFFHNQLAGFGVPALRDQAQVAGDVDAGRAGLNAGGLLRKAIFGADGPQGARDVKDPNAVRAGVLAASAGGAEPGHGGGRDLLDQVQLHVPDQPADVEAVDARDGAGRAAAPALLAEPEHLDGVEALGEFIFATHLLPPRSNSTFKRTGRCPAV
jgi:hypothetical protein